MNRHIILLSALALGVFSAKVDARELDSLGEANYLYVDPETNELNEEGFGEITIYLDNATADFNSFMFDIYLPDELMIPSDEYGFYCDINSGRGKKTFDHTLAVVFRDMEGQAPNFYRVVGLSMQSNVIATGDDWLIKFTVKTVNGLEEHPTMYDAAIKNIEFAAKSNTVTPNYLADAPFTILDNGKTGVADVVNAEIGASVNGCHIALTGVKAGTRTRVTAIDGKVLFDTTATEFDVPAPGIYLLTIEGSPRVLKVATQ